MNNRIPLQIIEMVATIFVAQLLSVHSIAQDSAKVDDRELAKEYIDKKLSPDRKRELERFAHDTGMTAVDLFLIISAPTTPTLEDKTERQQTLINFYKKVCLEPSNICTQTCKEVLSLIEDREGLLACAK